MDANKARDEILIHPVIKLLDEKITHMEACIQRYVDHGTGDKAYMEGRINMAIELRHEIGTYLYTQLRKGSS